MKKIGAVLAKKRREAHMSQTELANRLGKYGFFPSGASVSSWEKNVSIPNALQFLALCEELDIREIADEFFEDEKGGLLSGLNEAGKKKVNEYISLLLLSEEYREETNKPGRFSPAGAFGNDKTSYSHKVVPVRAKTTENEAERVIRLYNLPASAGTGEFLDGEDYTEVVFGNDIPPAADFGIRIKGNSMEPRYSDGQTVWVKRMSELQSGEIGIFFLDGNAYCKKIHIDENGVSLVSINREYKPINITEESNLVTFGKVLN